MMKNAVSTCLNLSNKALFFQNLKDKAFFMMWHNIIIRMALSHESLLEQQLSADSKAFPNL